MEFPNKKWPDEKSHQEFIGRNYPETLDKLRAFQNQPIPEVQNKIIDAREKLSKTRDLISILQDEIIDMQATIDDLPTSIRYRMDSTARANRRNQLLAQIRNNRKQIKTLRLSEIEPLSYRIKFLQNEFNL